MERITLKNIIANPFKVVRNYNRLIEWQFLAEQKLQQFEADNHILQNELDCMHISHDWYVKWEKAQGTIKDLQDTLTLRHEKITELEEKVQRQRRALSLLQITNEKRNAQLKEEVAPKDRGYVRKLQEQLARKCERIEELKTKVAELEGNIVMLRKEEVQ